MKTMILDKIGVATVGRPTAEIVRYRQSVHDANKLLTECHQRVVSLEAKVTLLSNLAQRQKLEIEMMNRNLNIYNRI